MERESFEDDEVAALLNEHFVSVKVDREERPDVDHLYMTVCQAMTGQGGWPLTVVLTPDRKPFFAGTYFPKSRKYNRYGLMEILPQIVEKWTEDPEKVSHASEQITEATKKSMLFRVEGQVSDQTIHQAYDRFVDSYDAAYGGFGSSPKFPTAHNLCFLLRYYKLTGQAHALEMAEHTLISMYRGGMYDHVGKGFSRYSTDERWLVPHFEKMLYDNALLAMAYIEAYQVTGKSLYRQVAEEIFTYVLRDMTDLGGAFYSAEDADSEGVEGKFYVWTPEEVHEILGETDGELFCEFYDITDEGNFEKANIPNLLKYTVEQYAQLKGKPEGALSEHLNRLGDKLFAAREGRVHPHKDDKVLTSWNGLMIMALAKGAKAFGVAKYAHSAEHALQFLTAHLRRPEDGRLLARYRDGESAIAGYVDDYAFLLWGCLELYEATFNAEHLKQAVRLADEMIDLFWDGEDGGFFFYGHDGEQLLTRIKEIYDGAVPSGNAVALYNLLRLARFTSNERYETIANETIRAFGGAVDRYPAGHSIYLMGLIFQQGASREIVIAGDMDDANTRRMLAEVQRRFLPDSILIHHAAADDDLVAWMPLVEGKAPVHGQAAAYVCENFACQAPTTDVEQLRRLLS